MSKPNSGKQAMGQGGPLDLLNAVPSRRLPLALRADIDLASFRAKESAQRKQAQILVALQARLKAGKAP